MFPLENLAAPETRLPFFGLAPVLASDAKKSSLCTQGAFSKEAGARGRILLIVTGGPLTFATASATIGVPLPVWRNR